MSVLKVELVPRSAWWKNVRSNVTRAQWDKCKKYARAKTAGGLCIICGGSGFAQGRNYTTDAHEVWEYDDENEIQTLVDIIPLCPTCHACKHLGRTRATSNRAQWERVINHLQSVNEWSDDHTLEYVQLAFQIWELRSQVPTWKLDITFLERELDIAIPQTA